MKRSVLKRMACFAVALALAAALLPVLASTGNAAAAASEFPAVFDLRNVDTDGDGIGDACWVTPVKCQDPFGTCWGFAAIASAETSILSSGLAAQDGYAAYADPEKGLEELNLSEKHLAYFAMKTVDDPADPQYGEGMVFIGEEGSSDILDTGGLPLYATSLFASGVGPVREDLDEQFEYRGRGGWYLAYVSGDRIAPIWYAPNDDWTIDDELRFYQSFVLKASYVLESPAGLSGEAWESAVNAMKDVLYSGHAIEIAFCSGQNMPGDDVCTEYLNENWAHYTYEYAEADHAVTIVGWDDHYPKENFAHKTADGSDAPLPERDGAWLVKNSWGSEEREFPYSGDWGLLQGQDKGVYNAKTGKYEYNAIEGALHTGYFWLSYCDKSIDLLEALEFDAVTAEEGYFIAEHDYMPVAHMASLLYDSETSMANVFCVGDEVDAARLEMVSIQTFDRDVDLHVDVYVLEEDWTEPTDGKLVSQADTRLKYGGFHKIMLDTPVVLLRDQYFSVVVTQTKGNDKYYVNYQLGFSEKVVEDGWQNYCVAVVNPRESFFGAPGDWKDMTDPRDDDPIVSILGEGTAPYYIKDNFPIKAYLAVPSEAEIPRTAADYADLEQGTWYYDAASWLIDSDIAMGTAPDAFSPYAPCSRGQIVTWLWRAAGMPEPETKDSPFRDVNKGDYFYYAALWAAENGIIDGVADGVFAPGRTVTRAHMAAILYRYEQLCGGGFTGMWAFPLSYADAGEIPDYAYEAFCYLTMNGVFEGDGENLNPNDTCTRAHAACVLQRYFEAE